MTFAELQRLIAADQFRYMGGRGMKDFLRQWVHEGGFRFSVVMRTCRFLRSNAWSRYGLYHLCLFWHRSQQFTYGVHVDFTTDIGPGLYIGHPVAIVINRRCIIGANCTLSHGVTLGQTNARSKSPGCPQIGDRVYLGCGSVIIGGITLGNDSVISPNAVVIRDVGPSEVVSGNPATVISTRGSDGYVSHCSEASGA